jgi:hypothetical protein
MNHRMLPAALAAVLAIAAAFAPDDAASQAAGDGLVKVKSRMLDSLEIRPESGLPGYRKVMVDPAQAALAKNWLKDMNTDRSVGRRLVPEDAERINRQAAASLTASVAEGFRQQGYEVVTAAGEGVLRLTAAATDLYVNAPDVPTAGLQTQYVRDAGDAVLQLDARDSVSGSLLARVVHKGTANEMRQINRSSGGTNVFWFEALFRQWASNSAKAFTTAGAAKGAKAKP